MTVAADCAAWIEHGLADARAGRSADALASFGKATACDPSAPGPHFHRGEILWQLGRRPDAIAAWREALLRDPDFIVPLADALPLARRYAERAAAVYPMPFPLLWPRRTGGARLRVVVLPGSAVDPVASRALDSIKALPADRFDLVIAALGATSPAAVAAAAASYPGKRIVALTPALDGNDAKRLALLDPDVLVDLAGLTAPTGPLLACRPARRIVTVTGVAFPHVPPLVDSVATLAPSPGDALERLRSDATAAVGVPDAAGMTSLWEGAVRAHQQGALPVARLGYERVLAMQPGYAPAHYLLGMVLRDGGDVQRARVEFDAAIAAAPRFVDARVAAAKAARDTGDNAAAIALCTLGLRDAPHSAPLWSALGLARLAADDAVAAAGALERAANLAPKDADIHFKLGVAFQKQRIHDAAEKAYRQAIALRPAFADAHFNLGVLCQERGSLDAAIAAYATALDADHAHVAAYENLGEVLFAAGRLDDWFANFRRFEANCPDALPMLVQGLEVCHYLPDFRKLDTCIDRIAAGRYAVQDDAERVDCLEQILYLLLFFDVAPDVLLELTRTYDTAARRVYGELLRMDAVRRSGRLRIGYLSADLRNHVMGKMVWQAVQHHDRTRFELFFYSLSQSEDEWTARFRGLADRFTVLAVASERAAAATIAADDLDILIDLSTHTRGAKPGILAAKPARVQITYVASAGTVGLATVDFKLTDRYADLPESAACQIERPLPMDGCVYPYRHIVVAARHPFHRDAFGISADAVVIGAFVTGLKLSRRCLDLWRQVLARVPRAVLAFSPVMMQQRALYLRLAAVAGIAADRIVFVPQGCNDAENQARYTLVDFVLDPMPYGGANGTLEALDMGVPVVTLVGTRHGERSSFSILSNLGVTRTVAHAPAEYVAIACRLADDPSFLAEVRTAIATGLAGSTLTDAIGHTRALERAYATALAAKELSP